MTDPVGGSLVNLGELAKPAVIFIEKISHAVGGIAKPWQIKRVAHAEAAADLVRADARIKISELEERALRRMLSEETRKQSNIESITGKALPHLSESAKSDAMSNDWIFHFFEKAKFISEDQMQEIWAKILAGEANKPGHFSKKTIDVIASLEYGDAELFSKLRQIAWNMPEPSPLVFDANNPCNFDTSLTFAALHHLDDLGLINVSPAAGYNILISGTDHEYEELDVSYFNEKIVLQVQKGTAIDCGKVMLTNSGTQIMHFCEAEQNLDFFHSVLTLWIDNGLLPFSRLPR